MPKELIPGEKRTVAYKKSGFKMKGWGGYQSSPMTKKTDHPKKESPPEHKDLEVTATSSSEKKADIRDRIEFLKTDIKEGKISHMEGGKQISTLTRALSKLR